jgi:hypothetical protein
MRAIIGSDFAIVKKFALDQVIGDPDAAGCVIARLNPLSSPGLAKTAVWQTGLRFRQRAFFLAPGPIFLALPAHRPTDGGPKWVGTAELFISRSWNGVRNVKR